MSISNEATQFMTDATAKQVSLAVMTTAKGSSNTKTAIDSLVEDGVQSTMLFSPDKGKNKELSTATSPQYNHFLQCVVRGLTKAEQKLHNTKDRETMSKVTGIIGDWRLGLQRREAGGTGKGGKARPPIVALTDYLNKMERVIGKAEELPCDVLEMMSLVKEMQALIKG